MSETESCDTLDVVVFSAGGWRLGFEARCVRGARPAGQSATNEQEGHIAALLGLPPDNSPPTAAQWLDIKQIAAEDRKILVAGPVELQALPVASIHPLPPLLAARTRLNGLRALVLQEDIDKIVLLFDVPSVSHST
ncbi:hypothetical protein [Azonexus sp.]|uniref:hypothetical protein n=1 Tax=Azonexus sp. TaxID=1872668 RepID=UPI0027B9B5BB|nr:hypothetical protein [Azonexus sp.]